MLVDWYIVSHVVSCFKAVQEVTLVGLLGTVDGQNPVKCVCQWTCYNVSEDKFLSLRKQYL